MLKQLFPASRGAQTNEENSRNSSAFVAFRAINLTVFVFIFSFLLYESIKLLILQQM